jgi:hypothetical protein
VSERGLASSDLDNFYVIGDKSFRNAAGIKLCGRDREIEQSLLFLFGSDTFSASRESEDRFKPIFSLNSLAKYVVLYGTQGMGKTAVASVISHHIYSVAKKSSAYNIQLFKSLVKAYVMSAPFSAWKPVLQEMAVRMYQGAKNDIVQDTKKRRRRSLAANVAAINKELQLSIDHLFTLLSPEWKDYRALISRITNVEEDCGSVAALNLNETDLNEKSMGLAMSIVQIYPKVTGKLAFVVM